MDACVNICEHIKCKNYVACLICLLNSPLSSVMKCTGVFFNVLSRSHYHLQSKPAGVAACEGMVTLIHTFTPGSWPRLSQHYAAVLLKNCGIQLHFESRASSQE